MVQFLPQRPKFAQAFGEAFAQGIGQLPGQVSDALGDYQKRKVAEKEQDVLARYTAGEKVSPQELKRLSIPTQLKLQEIAAKKEQAQRTKKVAGNIKKSLIDAGYPKETADLWQNQYESATLGGQTDIIKSVDDLLKRSQKGRGETGEQTQVASIKPIDIPGIDQSDLQLDFPPIPEPEKLTTSEMTKKRSEREKINTPLYGETIDKLDSLEDEFRDLRTLDGLEKTGNLPTALEKWNVDWNTGDLRFLAEGHPDAQAYVKTIYRMLRKARDFFPGRVTNFDLEQFKKNFPTLANSPEGRRLILQQLELGNRIAFLKEETLKSAIDHYGADANPQKVRQYANENYRRLKGSLEDQLINLNSASVEEARRNEQQIESQQGQAFERKKVDQGTKITDDIVDKYLALSGNDPVKAEQMAREDGYEF